MRLLFIFIAAFCCLTSYGQAEFKNLRFDEDYSSLRDSSTLSWYDRMKFSRLNKNGSNYISFGGEARYQYFKFENEDWGDAPPDNDGYILSRLLLHGDLHFNKVRLFTQLQSSLAAGRENPSAVEQNELDLHQLFLDFPIAKFQANKLVLRVGRQEMTYGSARLVGVREAPNNRQSFDGAKLIFLGSKMKGDVFYSRYVKSKSGIFNDEFMSPDIKFYGAYFVFKDIPTIKNIDLYYFGIKKEHAIWNDVAGTEARHSIGSRVWGQVSNLRYDVEGVLQFGNIDYSEIRAWTFSINAGYTFGRKPLSPTIGLKTEVISGDNKPGDGRTETFNPLFPKGAYFGYAALIGPSNIIDFHPSLDIPLNATLLLSFDCDIFWRYSNSDGMYSPNTSMIYPAGDSNQKFIGQQFGTTLTFSNSKYFEARGEFTWFNSGPYVKSMGEGQDILFAGATVTVKF